MHTIFSLYLPHKSAICQSSETFSFSTSFSHFFLNPHTSNSPIYQTPRKRLFSLLDLFPPHISTTILFLFNIQTSHYFYFHLLLCKKILFHLVIYNHTRMSLDIASERVCYVHCNFCNTILAVSVPCSSVLINAVTIRCEHCTNLLSVNMGALLQTLHLHDLQNESLLFQDSSKEFCGSSSKCHQVTVMDSSDNIEQPRMLLKAQEKKQRVPSAYNRFIKEEIQRIKANNPAISHKEAFSTAAKNWAHFPHIHFGLTLNNNKNDKAVFDEAFSRQGSRKTQGL